MTPYQCIAANIRHFRTIPKGSILWVDVPQHDLFLSVLDIGEAGNDDEVH